MEEMSESNHLDESKYEEEPSHEPQQQQQLDESELFWRTLRSELDEDIPTHVKNVLRLCRLDRPLAFRAIGDETLDEAERFARRDMKYQLLGVAANLEDYYGPYERAPHRFRFAVGDRLVLKQLAGRARAKPDDFWRASETQRQQQPREDASSELEPSDEEERGQPDEPPNLEHERRRLADMVRGTLLKEEYAGGEDPRRVAARVKVRVELRPMQEADGATRDVVTGHIKCVFCATRLMIRKQSFGTRKPRWVISNYRRHIRFHLDGKLKRPAGLVEAAEQQRRGARCKSEFVECAEEHEAEEHDAEEREMEEAYS